MKKPIRWRVTSDYIGAGSFVVSRNRLVVGTEYGVQCVPLVGNAQGWEVDLGSRCLGVVEGRDRTLYASCLDGIHALTPEGHERWGAHSLKQIVCSPVPFQEGIVFTSRDAFHYYKEWHGSEWRFDLADVLGKSVSAIRVVNIFGMDQYVVAGVVDYDSGIGRVIVIYSRSGRRVWMSDPGPLSEVFAAGQGVFVWSQTGYGKFETRMNRLDGHEIWVKDIAGVGSVRPDGSIAMLVGSNESPTWDDWEYRQFSPGGKPERSLRGKGRCVSRPLCLVDGTVYFIGTVMSGESSAARAGDTRFFHMPQEELFQHLMGIKLQLPIHDIYLHRLRPDGAEPEIGYHNTRTYSLGDLKLVGDEVVFCDGLDIVAIEA